MYLNSINGYPASTFISNNLSTTSSLNSTSLTLSLADYNKILKLKVKKIKHDRDTGFKGVHVHYDKQRENISFRPTLKIDRKEQLGYNNFNFDYFGLMIAVRFKDKFIMEHNLPKELLLIKDRNIALQVELAIQHSDLFSLKLLYKTLTDKPDFDFERIKEEIENEKNKRIKN